VREGVRNTLAIDNSIPIERQQGLTEFGIEAAIQTRTSATSDVAWKITLSVWERWKRVLSNNANGRSCREPQSVLHAVQFEYSSAHTTL